MSRNLVDMETIKLFLLLGKYETTGDIIKFIDAQRVFIDESNVDSISRDAVLKLFAMHDGKYLYKAIQELPAIQSGVQVGTWVYDKSIDSYRCKDCGCECYKDNLGAVQTRFCSMCGRKMVVD